MKLNSSRKFLVFITAGSLLFSLGACSVVKNDLQATSPKSDSQVLNEVRSGLKSVTTQVHPIAMDLWWVTQDGYSIINDNSPGLEAHYPGCVNDLDNQINWRRFATKTVAIVDRVLLKEGFTLFDDPINNSRDISDTRFYDYIKSYQRGSTKAVLAISPDCGSTSQETDPPMYYSASFGYTNKFQQNYDAQSPFLYDLELKDVVVHIAKSLGEYRVLNINYRRSGHSAIVQRINGKWTQLWAGQDLISCAERTTKKIPISLAPDCY
jgi:hypothetical protein